MSVKIEYPTNIPPVRITATCKIEADDNLVVSAFSRDACSVRITTSDNRWTEVVLTRSDAVEVANAILCAFEET